MALVLVLWIYVLGIRSERTGFVDRVLDPSLKRITQPVLNAFSGRPPEVPRLWIDEPSVRDTALITDAVHWVEVEATLNDGSHRLRLGAWPKSDGPVPWRITSVDGPGLLGLTTFEASPAENAGVVWSWTLRALFIQQGLPALRMELADVAVGKGSHRLYALEQIMDSTWMAGHGSAMVLELDEELRANARRALAERRYASRPMPQSDWVNAPIQVHRSTLSPGSDPNAQQWVDALDALRTGSRRASEVLDVDRTAQLLALCDMMGAGAMVEWWNFWFLPDKTTGRFTLVPKTYSGGIPLDTLQVHRTVVPLRARMPPGGFHDRLFGDPAIYMRYIAYLDTLAIQGRMDSIWAGLAHEVDQRLRIVTAEHPSVYMDTGVLEHAISVVRSELYPTDPALCYAQRTPDGQQRLMAASVHALPVAIHGAVAGGDTIPLVPELVLWPRAKDNPLSFISLRSFDALAGRDSVKVLVGTLGTSGRIAVPVRTWSTLPASREP